MAVDNWVYFTGFCRFVPLRGQWNIFVGHVSKKITSESLLHWQGFRMKKKKRRRKEIKIKSKGKKKGKHIWNQVLATPNMTFCISLTYTHRCVLLTWKWRYGVTIIRTTNKIGWFRISVGLRSFQTLGYVRLIWLIWRRKLI